jgi:hypothetical protein
MPGAVEHRGGLDAPEVPLPEVVLPGAESKVVAVRRVPAVRVESLDWTLVGGRRQLLWLLCRCPLLQSAAVASRLASAVPEARTKVGVDAHTGEVSRRDVLGGLIHEDHAVTA